MGKTRYFTYILECSDSTFYIGMTTDIVKRLKQHNGKLSGGARYTRQRNPVVLCYLERHKTYKDAAKREMQMKKLTHLQKEKLTVLYTSCVLEM